MGIVLRLAAPLEASLGSLLRNCQRAGSSRPWATLHSRGPPRVLGPDRADRGHARARAARSLGHTVGPSERMLFWF
jgi:hypothetical protein